jgi:hypothetical protein
VLVECGSIERASRLEDHVNVLALAPAQARLTHAAMTPRRKFVICIGNPFDEKHRGETIFEQAAWCCAKH